MDVSRRDVLVAGAMTFGAASLLLDGAALAQGGDDAAVKQSIDTLRQATFAGDKSKLAEVTAAQLSYGHSDGRVETKDEFITAVVNRKAKVKLLEWPELKVAVVGDAAVARHIWLSESELDGKVTNTKIGVIQFWQKQAGAWKLLGRQGFRLPTPA